jgi:hypothetical protein
MPITPDQASEFTEAQRTYLSIMEDYVDGLLSAGYDPHDKEWLLVIQVAKLRDLLPEEYRKRIGYFVEALMASYREAGWEMKPGEGFYPPSTIRVTKA